MGIRLKGERWGCSGNGMTAIVRKRLLGRPGKRAIEAGVNPWFENEVDLDDLGGSDLAVAADGANSGVRDRLAHAFEPSFGTASATFIWFGTICPFDGLTFVPEAGPDGTFAVQGRPIGAGLSTFIVETDEATLAPRRPRRVRRAPASEAERREEQGVLSGRSDGI